MSQASTQPATEMTNTPSRQRQYDDTKLPPGFCEFIRCSRRMIRIEFPEHQSMLLKRLEATRKHIGSDARQTFLKILKAHRAGQKLANNQQGPARSNDIKCSGDRARFAEASLCHATFPQRVASFTQVNSI